MGILIGLLLKAIALLGPAFLITRSKSIHGIRKAKWVCAALLPALLYPLIVRYGYALLGGDIESLMSKVIFIHLFIFAAAWLVYILFKTAVKPAAS